MGGWEKGPLPVDHMHTSRSTTTVPRCIKVRLLEWISAMDIDTPPPPTPPPPQPVKSLEFYYTDGNIVFRVRSSTLSSLGYSD